MTSRRRRRVVPRRDGDMAACQAVEEIIFGWRSAFEARRLAEDSGRSEIDSVLDRVAVSRLMSRTSQLPGGAPDQASEKC